MHAAIALSGDDDDDLDRARLRFAPPDNEVPAAVGVSGVIGRSPDAAVLLVGLSRCTVGLQIDLAIRLRLDPEPSDDVHARFHAGLLVGVELADGRTVVAGRPAWPAPDGPFLAYRGGGGGGREWSTQLWLTPEPPPGDLVVVVAHPGLGIDESRVTVAAAALRSAAGRTEVLWPREPERPRHAVEPPPVDVPPGGWFERAFADPTTA
ncbi:hypothetical protein J1G42_00870 [Cellulomonas sp. zg-ZUI222]|uniref:Uncharacterized protein n=1 Tax=Cellulomonas wangleii TaxID=2816956 RepID=A0ABX8D4S8_9CELL|nr:MULTISPECIES: hypothetical protein [Cellulomonas]MBO0898514.1 hypothetical protein [Cellulomonas sp. zg-ZUI22]MBO0919378.1 hypothetical protein [Cellulomonas wangleii]MBO0924476.1 hypothetical protein [Cellulomonas wangleii]QVI62467.1 hypothetical protein KG103_00445 [Cellulomonas wangleii]